MRGGTLRINLLRGDPGTLDPVRINSKTGDDLALQLHDRLVTFDSNLNIVGDLAKRWSVSADGTVFRFELHTSVWFHDDPCFPASKGRRLVAADVVANFVRCCNPSTGSVASWAFTNRVKGAAEYYEAISKGTSAPEPGFTAVNDSVVEITLLQPDASFLGVLANALGGIIAPEAWRTYGEDVGRHPVGSGPFRIVSWSYDSKIILERNARYWQHDAFGNQLPYIDSLVVTFLRDDHQQLLAFEQSELDECFTIPTEAFPFVVDTVLGTAKGRLSKAVLHRTAAWCSWFVDANCARVPFNDARVRQAFAHAVDRHRLVAFVLQGAPAGAADYGIVPPSLPLYNGYEVRGLRFNPARARALLAQAGYADAQQFPSVSLTIYPEPRLRQTAEALQSMWAEYLGVHVAIRVVNFAQFLEMAELGSLDLWATRWYGDYPDPETFLSMYDQRHIPTSESAPSYPNSTRFRDDTVSSLIARALRSSNPDERLELYRNADQRVVTLSPSIPLFYERHYRLLQPWVRGLTLDPMARLVVKHTWFSFNGLNNG